MVGCTRSVISYLSSKAKVSVMKNEVLAIMDAPPTMKDSQECSGRTPGRV